MLKEITSVLLVDDHPVVRKGFRYLLESSKKYRVLEAESAEEAYAIYCAQRIDIVVLDLSMPGMGGLEGIRRLRARDDQVRILILSMQNDPTFVRRARQFGAMGYISKQSAPEELDKAIHTLLQGKEYLDPLTRGQVQQSHHPDTTADHSLSTREFEVLCMLAEGRSAKDIATDLSLSPKTVNNHRRNILEKLGLNSTVELTRFAIRHGLVQP